MRLLRRWWWAILVAVLLIVRAVLPGVVRSQIETRASEALHATVHVGDVDLALLTGGIALEDVTVQSTGAAPGEEPLLAWKRFAVDLRYLSLFRKTVRFATIELFEPHVALDRLQSGELNLMALVPPSDPNAPPAPADGGSGWKLGIDYLGLHRGGIRFRDLLLPNAEPLMLALESIEVRDIALEPDVYGGPADIRFVVKLDQGALRTRARFTPRKEGMAVDVTLDGTKLPVHRSRVYVPGVAWSDLTGLLSVALRYRLETGGRNEISGRIGLDDLTVWTAGTDEPALKWKSLGIELEKIDLVKHEARVKRVALDGAVVPVRPRGPEVLPVLAAAQAGAAAARARAPAPPSPDEPPSEPWRWYLGSTVIEGSQVRLLSDAPPIEVGVTLDAKGLAGPTHEGSPVKLDLTVGDGRLGIDGQLRLAPLGFAGTSTTAALDVPPLLDVTGAIAPGVLQVAKLDSDLKVALGSSAPTAGDVAVSGTVAVSDLWVAANDPKEFSAGAKRLALAIGGVTVPGAIVKEAGRGRPVTVAIDKIDVDAVYASVTRTETGIILPAFTTAAPGSAAPGSAAPASAAPAASPPAAEPPVAPPAGGGAAAPGAAGPQVTIDAMLAKGRVDVLDRTVQPFYWNAFDPLEIDLRQIHVPDVEIGAVNVHAVSATKGTIDVTGALTKKSDLELVVKDLALMPFNPYVTGLSPYSISRGALFVTTKASIAGPKYDTTTWVTLSNFDIKSRTGKNVVLEQLGIPLTVALALMRDWRGNIDLTIPVVIDEKGASVGLGAIVSGALMQALIGTLTSPLKLLGAVIPGGGSGEQMLAPAPIRFHAGLSTLDSAGDEQVKQLAAFLAGRPGLGVMLGAPVTARDVRALREQELLAKLGPRKGVIASLRNVGARGRVTDALTARARGEDGPLDDDDAKALDGYLEEVPAPSAEAIDELGAARLAVVEKALREQYGIGAGQITRAPVAPGAPAEGDPGVSVDIGTAGG